MAGTILSTPVVGSADWSGWITQQGATDTGFMRVSLTNFSGTVASSVATGGVMECAGSIYSFSETAISLAADTASADVAVYFQVIPSAGGGSTCTVVMDDTTPVWSDAKQGFYASAASLSRVIGGCYIGTAATYYNKYLYTGENLVYCLQTGETRPLLRKTYEIGEWNMDTTLSVNVPHGIVFQSIRTVEALISNDPKNQYIKLDYDGTTSGTIIFSTANIELHRKTSGIFDGSTYNATASTVANRGFVYIEYEA